MIIEWMRNNWTNKLYWYQHQNHTISQSSSSRLVMKGNRWMKDAINKRMSGTERNAIKVGGLSYSTCFCVLPSLETKRHSKVWLHLWSEGGCASVHTGEAFQLYSSSQVKDQVGIITNISQTSQTYTNNSFLGWGSERLRHLPQFIQLESRRDSTESDLQDCSGNFLCWNWSLSRICCEGHAQTWNEDPLDLLLFYN